MEKTSTWFCCSSSAVIPLEVTYDCSRRRPDLLFFCFQYHYSHNEFNIVSHAPTHNNYNDYMEVIMTVVKSVSDSLRHWSERLRV